MRADRSSSTIKRNNMELGKHVQLTLVSFEQQMLPTCRRLLFPCARGSRAIKEIGDANAIVCLSCFLFVCLRFGTALFFSRHICPIENMRPQKKT